MAVVEWIKLISIVFSIIGSIIALYQGYKKRKQREMEKHAELIGKINMLEIGVKQRLDVLDEKIDEVQFARNRDERDRLRESILQFADRLRLKNNLDELKVGAYVVDSTEYDIMFQNYKKYKALGGNGYIDEEMKYITKEFKKLKKSQ